MGQGAFAERLAATRDGIMRGQGTKPRVRWPIHQGHPLKLFGILTRQICTYNSHELYFQVAYRYRILYQVRIPVLLIGTSSTYS